MTRCSWHNRHSSHPFRPGPCTVGIGHGHVLRAQEAIDTNDPALSPWVGLPVLLSSQELDGGNGYTRTPSTQLLLGRGWRPWLAYAHGSVLGC